MAKTKKKPLEKSLKRLEEILQVMESGEIELENSIKLFEEGMTLVDDCQKQLQVFEKRVKILKEKPGDKFIEENIE